MDGRGAAAELDLAQGQRERNGGEREQHQDPEHVDIGKVGRLRLHLLADPGEGLLLRLGERAALRQEILRRLMQRILVLRARRNHMLDQPGLMELLAMR